MEEHPAIITPVPHKKTIACDGISWHSSTKKWLHYGFLTGYKWNLGGTHFRMTIFVARLVSIFLADYSCSMIFCVKIVIRITLLLPRKRYAYRFLFNFLLILDIYYDCVILRKSLTIITWEHVYLHWVDTYFKFIHLQTLVINWSFSLISSKDDSKCSF